MSEKHRKLFEEWMTDCLKSNSSLISKDLYIQVTDYINAKERGDDLDRYPRAIKRRVTSKALRLMSYAPLNLKNKLYTEVKYNVSKNKLSLFVYYQIQDHSVDIIIQLC